MSGPTTSNHQAPANDHAVIAVDFSQLAAVFDALDGVVPAEVQDAITKEINVLIGQRPRPVSPKELEFCYLQAACAGRVLRTAVNEALTVLMDGQARRAEPAALKIAYTILSRAQDANGVIATEEFENLLEAAQAKAGA